MKLREWLENEKKFNDECVVKGGGVGDPTIDIALTLLDAVEDILETQRFVDADVKSVLQEDCEEALSKCNELKGEE